MEELVLNDTRGELVFDDVVNVMETQCADASAILGAEGPKILDIASGAIGAIRIIQNSIDITAESTTNGIGTINVPGAQSLTVDFTASETNPSPNQEITLIATGDVGLGYLHVWDFGDGTTLVIAGSDTVTHAYSSVGDYTVTLHSVLDSSPFPAGRAQKISYVSVEASFSFNTALEFDGINDFISFSPLTNSTQFTLSYWFNQSNANSVQSHFGKSADNNEFIGTVNNSLIRWLLSGSQVDFAVPTLLDNTWYHVFITRDASNNFRLYLNGQESSTGPVNRTGPVDIDQIGRYSSGALRYTGKIDQVVYWIGVTGSALNAAEIFNSGLGSEPTMVIPSPNRYYPLDESGSSALAEDLGSDAQNATLNNFTLPGAWVTH